MTPLFVDVLREHGCPHDAPVEVIHNFAGDELRRHKLPCIACARTLGVL